MARIAERAPFVRLRSDRVAATAFFRLFTLNFWTVRRSINRSGGPATVRLQSTAFVKGFRLDPDAKRVLADDQGPPPLPQIRRITGDVRPIDACDYFCNADRTKPEFV